MSASLLIIDDEKSIRKAFSMTLSDRYDVHTAEDGGTGLEQLQKCEPDLVLLDIGLPDMDGMEVLRQIKKMSPDTVVIMVTAYQDIKLVVEATKLGAFDYLVKPIDSYELGLTVKNGLENSTLKRRVQLQQNIDTTRSQAMFASSSKVMQDISTLIDKVAPSIDTPVLVNGDTGTGKGVFARQIHFCSPNCDGPFITVNCGSIASELVESELFGYGKGAFTGARSGGRKGYFEEAAGGTLFLDEIGVMPIVTQAKLLSVLEDRAFYRVGSSTEIKVTARIIAATNCNLEEAVRCNSFRQDLFFRLNAISITIPSLKDRPKDILPLFEYFMDFFNKKTNKHFTTISPEASEFLTHYNWPGNVRELRNIMERISLLESGETILPEHLPCMSTTLNPNELCGSAEPLISDFDYENSKQRLITQAISKCNGNITKAAQLLNMPPHKLRYRIKTMAIEV